MANNQADPAQIAATFTISPDEVIARSFDPQLYPHQHLVIQHTTNVGSPRKLVPRLIAAVEMLAPGGWELVNLSQVADRTLIAVMRRTRV